MVLKPKTLSVPAQHEADGRGHRVCIAALDPRRNAQAEAVPGARRPSRPHSGPLPWFTIRRCPACLPAAAGWPHSASAAGRKLTQRTRMREAACLDRLPNQAAGAAPGPAGRGQIRCRGQSSTCRTVKSPFQAGPHPSAASTPSHAAASTREPHQSTRSLAWWAPSATAVDRVSSRRIVPRSCSSISTLQPRSLSPRPAPRGTWIVGIPPPPAHARQLTRATTARRLGVAQAPALSD